MKRFCCALIGASLVLGLAARAELVSGISVVVNDDVITYGEIAAKIAPHATMIAQAYANDRLHFEEEMAKIRSQQIEDLVERKLILHEFTSAGYVTNVLESFIDDQIKKTIQRDYYGDRARLIKTLQAQGVTYEDYRRQQREDFIVNYMAYQNVDAPKKMLISPLKIETYYKAHPEDFRMEDQVKLRMIVIDRSSEDSPGAAHRLADEVLSKIKSGVSFEEMAKQYSAGQHRTDGGDYGWMDRKAFKPELGQVAFSLKPGQHSDVIELPEACYIMLVEDVRAAHTKPLTEVREDIERTLKGEERSKLHKRWIEKLRAKSFVQYY